MKGIATYSHLGFFDEVYFYIGREKFSYCPLREIAYNSENKVVTHDFTAKSAISITYNVPFEDIYRISSGLYIANNTFYISLSEQDIRPLLRGKGYRVKSLKTESKFPNWFTKKIQ